MTMLIAKRLAEEAKSATADARATGKLAALRREAHILFDQLWQPAIGRERGRMSRFQAYVWLAKELGFVRGNGNGRTAKARKHKDAVLLHLCHFRLFDEATRERAIELCRKALRRAKP